MIVGIDEVGRGCWAGPLVAAAVVLPDVLPPALKGLTDSKKLSRGQRERLAAAIHEHALAVGVGWVSPRRIDVFGLTEAVRLAMQEALQAITLNYDEVIIDGSYNFLPEARGVRTLVGADALVPAVSAASIVAKVARDEYMAMAGKAWPEYGFEKHVGYGTAAHLAALKAHGVHELHRRSYKPIKALLELK